MSHYHEAAVEEDRQFGNLLYRCQQNWCANVFYVRDGAWKQMVQGVDCWELARGVTKKLACPKCGCTSFWEVKDERERVVG